MTVQINTALLHAFAIAAHAKLRPSMKLMPISRRDGEALVAGDLVRLDFDLDVPDLPSSPGQLFGHIAIGSEAPGNDARGFVAVSWHQQVVDPEICSGLLAPWGPC